MHLLASIASIKANSLRFSKQQRFIVQQRSGRASMADETIEQGSRPADSKDLQQQSKALDSLTDHVEDRQLDSNRVQQAIASIAADAIADRNAQRLKERELASVKINPADVEVIATELELDKKIAERMLREQKGDAISAIRAFLH